VNERKSNEFIHNSKNIAMKTFIIAAFGVAIFLSSCSTVYRSGQTPDDMYYASSPKVSARSANDEYVQGNSSRNDGRYDQQSSYSGYDDYANSNDRWLMMRVRNRSRWSAFDDYNNYSPYNDFSYGGMGGYGMGYGYSPGMGFGGGYYSPFSFGLGLGYGGFGYGSYFNNYYNWNSCYNPYYSNVVVINPKVNPAGYTTLRTFNMGGYSNRNYNNSSSRGAVRPNYNGYVSPNTSSSRVFYNNNTNRQYNGGNNRRVYSNNSYLGGGNNQSSDRPVRTYTPSNNRTYTPAPSTNNSYTPRSSGVSSGGGYSGGSSSGSGGGNGSRPSRR
jgi:hypothetical protein